MSARKRLTDASIRLRSWSGLGIHRTQSSENQECESEPMSRGITWKTRQRFTKEPRRNLKEVRGYVKSKRKRRQNWGEHGDAIKSHSHCTPHPAKAQVSRSHHRGQVHHVRCGTDGHLRSDVHGEPHGAGSNHFRNQFFVSADFNGFYPGGRHFRPPSIRRLCVGF